MLAKEVGGQAVGRPHLVGAERKRLCWLVFLALLAHAYSRIAEQGRSADELLVAQPLLPLEYPVFARFVRASPPNDITTVYRTRAYHFNAADSNLSPPHSIPAARPSQDG